MNVKLAAGTLALATLLPSCLGSNNAYNSIRNWNARVTDTDAVDEILFLGMVIIPVYSIALLGDYVIFNTVEYWGGSNPISDPGPFPKNEFGNKKDEAAE